MSDEPKRDPPPSRGRGATLLALLKKQQELRSRNVEGAGDTASSSSATLAPSSPPKPRGRAAMLQKLADLKLTRAGSSVDDTASVASATETMSVKEAEPCYYEGNTGKKTNGACNYISLFTKTNCGVHEYVVKFAPQIDSKSVKIHFVNEHAGRIRMFDGGSTLYLPTKLPNVSTTYLCTNPHDNTAVNMTFTFIKTKSLGDCIHLFNILFKRIMRVLQMTPIGRNYFDPLHTTLVPQHRLEILPGYAISVEEQEGGVMVCLDTQHRVMRTVSVMDYLMDLRHSVRDDFKKAAQEGIIGSSVLTRYNNKTYRIDDILWDQSPKSTFETHDKGSISYIDYYKKQHGIEIKDLNQPLLVKVESKRIAGQEGKKDFFICLIPELCFMTGLTDEMRSDFKVMKDVATHTRVTPNQRMNALRTYLDNVNSVPKAKQILEDWGLELKDRTVDLKMRILDPETILVGDNAQGYSNTAEFANIITKNRVLGPVDLKNWMIFYTSRDDKITNEFCKTIQQLDKSLGVRIARPVMVQLANDRTETYVTTLRSKISPEVQIIVFICPTSRDDRYSAIKKLCCAQMPVPTQVINSRTLGNPAKSRSIIQKIALQINCKLGGSLWTVRFPVTNWMICGIDVYHSPGRNKSVCAVVCSLNETMSRWFSTVIVQDGEIGNELRMTFAKMLEKYRDINGMFPSNVVIFRDGVGDGQLKHCQDYEVAQFVQCLNTYKLQTKLTVVVVQKRINTRLFLTRGGNNYENPPPGTVADTQITSRNWYDFFLIAQNVRQGTVTPTHYIVIHDTGNLKPDHVQRLSFKLCHLYYNWPGTIRVPAPCQYAHKLAYLVGQHMTGQVPSIELCDRLFYL